MLERDNTLLKSPSHTAPTKYSAAYSTGREYASFMGSAPIASNLYPAW